MEYAGVQSKEYADAMMKAGTPEKVDQEPIGTGPFFLVQYQKDAVIRYKAFPQFWGGKAKIDDLVFSITPDASVRWAKLQKGECHVMPYPNPADLDAIRKDANVVVLDQPGLNIGFLAYNTTKKPFDDVRVRKAINMAIDKKAIIDAVYLTTGVAAKNPDPADAMVVQRQHQGRPVRSRGRQEAARRGGIPERLRDRPVGDARATPIQPERESASPSSCRRISPRSASRPRSRASSGAISQAHAGGRAPDGMLGWTGDNGDPDNFLASLLGCESAKANGSNVAKFCYQPYEDLIQKAKTATSQAERQKLYEQAQVIFKQQAPWFTIAHAVQLKPVRKEVIDFKLSPFGRHTFYGVDIKE
jgi:dipeptide transport system substrate-binding protein